MGGRPELTDRARDLRLQVVLADAQEQPQVSCPDAGEPETEPAPSDDVIPDLLRYYARLTPDRSAILAPSARPMTYAALLRQIETTIRTLSAMGIGPGDRVAVVLRNGPEMAVCFLAVASMAACAPLNPAYRASEFDFYLQDLKPKAVILESGLDSPVREVAAQHGIPLVEIGFRPEAEAGAFWLEPREGPLVLSTPDDPALVLHTSGTTSRPKMVTLSQRNLLASARQIADSLELTAADCCLNVMPLFHIHGLVGAALSTLSAGGALVCTPGFQAAAFFDWLEEFRPSWYTAVPTMHQAVLARAAQLSWEGGGGLRFIRSCSSALPPRVMAQLEALFGVPVIEAYGMTEASHQMASNPLPPRLRKPGSVGLSTGTEIRILDAERRPLPPGEVGEIVIRGPGVMQGYVSPPEANADAFVEGGWFRTGDQGRLDAEGYLFIEGRTKEIINRGGEKISPREVDEALLEHPAVAEALAFALPEARLGEDVGAAVVLHKGVSVTEAELQSFVASRLAEFKVPRRVIFVDTMPKGATGKPQRIGLAEKLGIAMPAPPTATKPQERRAVVEPRSQLEQRLVEIWAEALRLERVGIYDDFFELGGDSQAAVQVALQIASETGRPFSAIDLINRPTIAETSALLSVGGGSGGQPQQYLARVQPHGSRPPLFCIGGGPLQRDLARLLGSDQPFLAPAYPDLSMLPRPCRLEDIAAFHVTTIRTEQPKGPYRVAGWCVDGLVAYEVAQQLRRQGEEVEILVLFDALNDPLHGLSGFQASKARLQRLGRKARFHLQVLRGLRLAEAPGYIAGRMNTLMEQARRKIAQKMMHARVPVPAAAVDMMAIQHDAAERYRPTPYDGRVLLLQRELRPAGEDPDERLGWGDLIADLRIQKVPGDHRDMFLEPHVQITAEALRRYLSAAETA